jgi:cytoskeletal protein RodZ
MKAFGNTWKAARVAKRLTLRRVSEHLNLSIGYLSDIEQSRKGPPDLEIVRKYEELVGIEDQSLITLASKLKTKVRPDITQSLQTRPKLNEVMFRVKDLPDDELDEIIENLNNRLNSRGSKI